MGLKEDPRARPLVSGPTMLAEAEQVEEYVVSDGEL